MSFVPHSINSIAIISALTNHSCGTHHLSGTPTFDEWLRATADVAALVALKEAVSDEAVTLGSPHTLLAVQSFDGAVTKLCCRCWMEARRTG